MKKFTTLALLASAAIISSCHRQKVSSPANDAAKFAGLWKGTWSCVSGVTSITLVASSANTLTYAGTIGNNYCLKAASLNITANGNDLTIPSQGFVDLCGTAYNIEGGGTLNGDTLTLTEAGTANGTCIFTGTR